MKEKEKGSSIRATQVAELSRIFRDRVMWGDVMTPELTRTINGKKDAFLKAFTIFIQDGGRVPRKVEEQEIHLVLPGHRGHPSPLITDALLNIDWGEVSREELQALINTPKETANHFTYFLANWGKENV